MRFNTYSEAFKTILCCLRDILRMLPFTFAKNTKSIVLNHPIYLLFFFSVITAQFITNAKLKVSTDSLNKMATEMEIKLDSIEMKSFNYIPYSQDK